MEYPHCGGIIDSRALQPLQHQVFDDARRCIVVDGEARRVTKTWWRVLQLLRERAGRFVPFDFLASASERLPGDGGSTESLKIHIMQLRRALTGSPFAIATKRGAGYGLFPASDVESIQFRRDRDQYRRLSTRLRATWAPGYRPRVSPNMILPGGPHGSWRSDDPR